MTALVVRADAGRLPLADASVDLVVSSPPYFNLRSYTDGGEHYDAQIGAEPSPGEYVDALLRATGEMTRVLKPSGSIWINLGDKYAGKGGGAQGATSQRQGRANASEQVRVGTTTGAPDKSLIGLPWRYALRCIDELGLILRAEVIWAKPNGLPESIKDRVRRSHEQWFHFTREPRYFAALDEVREPHSEAGLARFSRHYSPRVDRSLGGADGRIGEAVMPNPLGKIPGSVWTIPTAPLKVPAHLGIQHFAAFPPEWPRRLILGWSPPTGIVLDPFGGTGTTAMVARALGRTGISVDLSADYCRLAQWRTNDRQQVAKVAPPVVQMTLDTEEAS